MLFFGKKIWLQYKQDFRLFIDLFALLSSIRGFPEASEGDKIKLTRTQVNFVLLFVSLLWRLKLLGYVFNLGICDEVR